MAEEDRFSEYESEYERVFAALSDPDLLADRKRFLELSRRNKQLEPVIATIRALRSATEDALVAKELVEETPGHKRELAQVELAESERRVEQLRDELREQLLPQDPNDGRNVIVTIRGAEGGEEANLFAKDLYEMYLRYADRHSWRVEVLEAQPSDLGGINEVTFLVKGPDAWRRLKHEGGPHRVQRVPVTESQGRVHTSSAAVTVLPEADEVEVDIADADLRIDVYRSTGPGGQSVNTTDSAVRITHLPTGLVVAMQDEKSQIQNRVKALQVLRARLLKLEQDRQSEELSRQRREQVGSGGRSEKIRTYNYKDNRVTDHRIGLTLHKLDRVLQGELDELVDALAADERARQLGEGPGMKVAELRRVLVGRLGDPTEARLLLEEATGAEWARLLLAPDEEVAPERVEVALAAAARRRAGEPLQHVVGHWPFRRLELLVDGRALIPRPETELVVGAALAELERLTPTPERCLRALDLGTGTGAIALSLASEWPQLLVTATEASPAALELAEENRARLSSDVAARVTLSPGSWYEALGEEERSSFDLIVANPPYLSLAEWDELESLVRDHDPRTALVAGELGTEAIEAVVGGAPSFLRRPGSLVVEIGWRQGPVACELARAAGASRVAVLPDLAGRDRALVAGF